MEDWKEYYNPMRIFIFGKFMLLFNLFVFVSNLRRMPWTAALLVLVATVSCTLPFMLQHRQHGIGDAVFLRRVIVPSFLGLTVSVLLLSIFGPGMAETYGLSRRETFGMLFRADVKAFEKELHSEIERIAVMDELPEAWTYPEIQPRLLEELRRRGEL